MAKLFIVPQNDLESVEICRMLDRNGQDFMVTQQQWGASWEGLEPEIKEAIAQRDPQDVYGVELKGDSPYNDIDHHYYQDKNWSTGEILYEADRTQDKSSIEQVAELIGAEMSVVQQFIAANDKNFVEGMLELGEKLGLDEDKVEDMVAYIRREEHEILAKAQGITPEMESQAEKAIEEASEFPNGCLVVDLPHSKCATVTDRIPMQEYDGGLLILCQDGDGHEIDFYGKTEVVSELADNLGGWKGAGGAFTFWGISTNQGSYDSIEKVVLDIVGDGGELKPKFSEQEVEEDFGFGDRE